MVNLIWYSRAMAKLPCRSRTSQVSNRSTSYYAVDLVVGACLEAEIDPLLPFGYCKMSAPIQPPLLLFLLLNVQQVSKENAEERHHDSNSHGDFNVLVRPPVLTPRMVRERSGQPAVRGLLL